MKCIKYFTIFIFSLFLGTQIVNAAPSVSVSVSASTIEKGSSVTFYVTLKNVASWNIRINGNGATTGCSSSYADATSNGKNTNKTIPLTCKGSDIGLINFSVTGDATSEDGSNTTVSASKRVNVIAVRPKSANNYLKSITVGEYALTPEFNKETLEYTVSVPSTVNIINLEASLEDGTASLSGTGEMEVNEGINSFEIKVNAQNGAERIYKVNVIVEDKNPINVTIDENKYTVVKNAKNVIKPDLYEESTIKIGEFDIPAFVSDVTDYTLVALKNGSGNVVLAIYDDSTKEYRLYEEQKAHSLILYIQEPEEEFVGYIKTTITLNEREYTAFKVSDNSNFAIVYAVNIESGKSDYYVYNASDQTFSLYDDEMILKLQEENKKYKDVIIGFAGACVFLVIVCMFAFLRKPNKKLLKKLAALENVEKKEENSIQESKVEEVKKTISEEKKNEGKKKKKIKNIKQDEDPQKIEMKKEAFSKEDIGNNEKIIDEGVNVEEALEKMNDVEKIIEEYEKTMALSKKDLVEAKEKYKNNDGNSIDAEEKKSAEHLEETMFDILADDQKKKKKKRKS